MAPSRIPEEQTWDYIICGGGTPGCVLAGRLAEDPNISILLIGADSDNADLESTDMPGGRAQLFGTDRDLGIKNEPLKHANNRQIDLFRGRYLGGSSGCNDCLTIRGMKQDYDDWDVPGWSGGGAFDYMRKSETFNGKEWFNAAKREHGYDGPLHTEAHGLAPISERMRAPVLEKGLPFLDMFVTGETGHKLYGGGPHFTDFPLDKKAAFAMCSLLFNAQSRGWVDLRKDDPLGPPVVDFNYLANPFDELVLAEGCRVANEILMDGQPTEEVIKCAWPEKLTWHRDNETNDDWKPFVRDTAGTCYHPSGTSKMIDCRKPCLGKKILHARQSASAVASSTSPSSGTK